MKAQQPPPLPVEPLLGIYQKVGIASGAQLAELPVLGPRLRAVLGARAHFLNEVYLDGAGEDEFRAALTEFYERCVFPPLHADTVRRRAGFLRHALAHLLHSSEPLTRKAGRFLAVDGAYHVTGLGPMFWSALFQAVEPLTQPGCLRGVVAGLRRLRMLRAEIDQNAAETFGRLQVIYHKLLSENTGISALHLDHFLCLVAGMRGRELWSGVENLKAVVLGADLDGLIRAERSRLPLRRRIKERGPALQRAYLDLEKALGARNLEAVAAALNFAVPQESGRVFPFQPAEHTLDAIADLWQNSAPVDALTEFLGAEATGGDLALAAAVLHVREPKTNFAWNENIRQGWALLEDQSPDDLSTAQQFAMYNEALRNWCRQHRLHYLETPAVLTALVRGRREDAKNATHPDAGLFSGFCADTFQFLAELAQHNSRGWMNGQRARYQFVLREPLVELARALADRYVRPILNGRWELNLETSPRTGKALSSICKNDYGRSVPYQTCLWITFCRQQRGKKKDAQFFVRLDANGVSFGLRLGREVREAGKQFRRNVQEQADLLVRALGHSGALAHCQFARNDDWSEAATVGNAAELRAWAAGKTLLAGRYLPANAPLLRGDELVGEILLTFDSLLPAYHCAVLSDPKPVLEQQAGSAGGGSFTAEDFAAQTHLDAGWLARAQGLLALKRQLILQGVPGTGKTFVAQALARWLTAGRPNAVRLVQFHPTYSYEEFVEGIRAKSVESNGRHDVTYPVEDGVLCDFAARAAKSPTQPFVLIVDEINRGNLPRVFGELLYLLEYRGQSVVLPYSRRELRLPANLYLIGTMNAADRSVTLIDQALRRRFSFLDMAPDARLLAAWLEANPPRAGRHFATVVVELFEQLNRQLLKELGPLFQVGHSYFMAAELDEDRLRVIWEHQVRPLLAEYFAGQPGRADTYRIDRLLQAHWRERSARTRSAAAPVA